MANAKYVLNRLEEWKASKVGQHSHLGHIMLHTDLEAAITLIYEQQEEIELLKQELRDG